MSTDEPPVRAEHSGAKPARKRTAKRPAATGPENPASKSAGSTKAAKPPTRSSRRPARPVVAVTGAAHGVGELLVRRLASSDAVKKVVAIDAIRGDTPQATWRLADVRDPGLADRLAGVDVVVHLAVERGLAADRPERRTANLRGTATVLTAAAATGVKHVVLVTSAVVYGAQPDNPVPLPEDAPARATPDGSVLGDLVEIERLAEQAPRTHPGLAVTVLRPAALVGPGIDSVVTRHFEAPRLLAVKGAEMRWQFCHVEDLVSALEVAAVGRLAEPGSDPAGRLVVAAVGSDGSLDRGRVEAVTGKRHIELPASVAFGTADRLHRIGATPASSSDIQYLVYPWAVTPARLLAHGWQPRFSNEEALRACLAESVGRLAIGGHRLGRRDAAAGAAVGATVALAGTAALVRRARRRRRG
jgi:nucleoside-diphosphate-sugar epimerase